MLTPSPEARPHLPIDGTCYEVQSLDLPLLDKRRTSVISYVLCDLRGGGRAAVGILKLRGRKHSISLQGGSVCPDTLAFFPAVNTSMGALLIGEIPA